MTKEAFINRYLDELVGLLLASFAQREKTNHLMTDAAWAADGKFMREQMNKARAMLGRQWDDFEKARGAKP